MSDFQIVIQQRFLSVSLMIWGSFVPGVPLTAFTAYFLLRHDPAISTVSIHPTTTVIGLLAVFAVTCCLILRKLLFHPTNLLSTPSRQELTKLISAKHQQKLENTWGARPESTCDLLLGFLVKRYFRRLSLCWILGGIGLGFAIMLTMFCSQAIYLTIGAPIWAIAHFSSRPKREELQHFLTHLG